MWLFGLAHCKLQKKSWDIVRKEADTLLPPAKYSAVPAELFRKAIKYIAREVHADVKALRKSIGMSFDGGARGVWEWEQ